MFPASLSSSQTLSLGLLLALAACKTSAPVPGDTGSASNSASESDTATATATGTGTGTGTDTGTDTDTGTATETSTGEPACSSESPAALMNCVEQPRYEQDLGFIADIRVPGSAHWQAVQDLCADRLTELGYTIELQKYETGVNVIGVRQGTTKPEERVLVGAHYDHIEACSGADDNATGVAATLELARVLADVATPRTLVITCWDEEELGLLGSKAQAQLAVDNGDQITAVFDFEMVGYRDATPGAQEVPAGFDLAFPDVYAKIEANEFRGDFLFWVSDDTMAPLAVELAAFGDLIDLPTAGTFLEDAIKTSDLVADLRRSDHAAFWDHDIPAMMLNDTGNFRYASYHCLDGNDDTIDRLDHEFSAKIIKVTVASTALALGL